MRTNYDILLAMMGGSTGGKFIATGTTDADVSYLSALAGTTFTVLTNDLDEDLLGTKGLRGYALEANIVFGAGTGRKFKAVSYSGFKVFGF